MSKCCKNQEGCCQNSEPLTDAEKLKLVETWGWDIETCESENGSQYVIYTGINPSRPTETK